MENILEKIDQLKETLSGLTMKPEDHARLDKKFRLEFNFNSNHIEGNTLTYGETELLLMFGHTGGQHSIREYDEMRAHDAAFLMIQDWAKDSRLISEAEIKQLNKVILVRPFWKEAITPDGQSTRREILVGDYKKYPNSVRLATGELFEYTSPTDTPIQMQELMGWFHKAAHDSDTHPLILAALFHYKFVRIHPFDDGNGRIARLLMNYTLFRSGYPPVVIKSADKTNYLRALNQADAGDTAAFVRYVAEQLIWSLELSIKAAQGEPIDEPSDLDKELVLLKKQLSQQSKLQQEKTPAIVAEVIEHQLIPIFQLIEEKLEGIGDLFFEIGRSLSPSIVNNAYVALPPNADWNQLKLWLQTEFLGKSENMSQFSYAYRLNGLKSNVQAPSFGIYLSINFNPYNYSIGDKDNVFPYTHQFTPEERLQLVTPLIKDLITRIKNAS